MKQIVKDLEVIINKLNQNKNKIEIENINMIALVRTEYLI